MKIAIIGYGKMGRMIEEIARSRGHEIVSVIDVGNFSDMQGDAFRSADVAIEFTTPSAAPDNIIKALRQGVRVVSGSTGWASRMDEVNGECRRLDGTMLWSSNFSLGVNIFFAVNRFVARIMERFDAYRPTLTEVHHVHKADHPSGTAVTLADDIVAECPRTGPWTEDVPAPDGALIVNHVRRAETPGRHIVDWDSEADTITIAHNANSRRGFALGAVIAAEWLSTRRGLHTMDDMMQGVFGLPERESGN